MSDHRDDHWETVYATKSETEVSWFQADPEPSLSLIDLVGTAPHDAIIDIGGGASRLVDSLLKRGFDAVTVLDLSPSALDAAKARLGSAASRVDWVVADATVWRPTRRYSVWHDRAAFHFLVSEAEQAAYVERLREGLVPGGHVIMGTFAPDGPERCSGLPVVRHSTESVAHLLGRDFRLVDARPHGHLTPWGSVQKFQFSTFRRDGAD